MTQASKVFVLPRGMAEEIVAHAREEKPRECCGIIAGRSGEALQLIRTTNAAPGNELYDIAPDELYRLECETRPNLNMEIVASYDSHPLCPARPSSTDIALAAWEEACYLICSLEHEETPVLKGFYMRDGNVTSVEVLLA
ncbi:MAG: Mov34/MPN/PAD-1 family protein [Chloroflexota bacterium]